MEENQNNIDPIEEGSLRDYLGEVSIPDRMFFKIGEVAEITKLKPYVLRFWETEFKELAPRKANNNQRKYTKSEIEMLLLIRKLLYDEKFTIEGAKQKIKVLRSNGELKSMKSLSQVKSEHKQQLTHIRDELLELRKIINSCCSDPNIMVDA